MKLFTALNLTFTRLNFPVNFKRSDNICPNVPPCDNVITMAGAKQYLKARCRPVRQPGLIWAQVHIRAHIRSRYSNNVFIYTLSSVSMEPFQNDTNQLISWPEKTAASWCYSFDCIKCDTFHYLSIPLLDLKIISNFERIVYLLLRVLRKYLTTFHYHNLYWCLTDSVLD